MRLTLRTLLAYLDDRLSPGNARELGQKIVKSPFATELADRIRNVVRRRRLAADSSEHKSIDANLIAEYLDDQLTPELVALIEKEVLGSDHSLAEVAASHQILGLLSDPVEISESLRGRLHKLDPFVDSQHEVAAVPETTASAEWKPLPPQAAKNRRSPMLLLLLMVAGWLGLLFSDSNLFRSKDTEPVVQPAGNGIVEDPLDVQVAAAEAPDQIAAPITDPATTPTAAETAPDASATALSNDIAAKSPAAPTAPDDLTEPNMTVGQEAAPVVAANRPSPPTLTPDSSVVAVATPADTTMKPQQTELQPADAESNPPPTTQPGLNQVFEVRDENRMHIMRHPDTKVWEWATAADAEVSSDWGNSLSETVSAVPTPFRVQLISRESGWLATFAGGSLFRSVSDDTAGVELFEGRAILQRRGAGKAETIAFVGNGQPIMIAIPESPEERIGISVVALADHLSGQEAVDAAEMFPFGAASVVTVFAADGPVTLTIEGIDQAVTIDRGKSWQWNTGASVPPAANSSAGQLTPEWVYQTTSAPPESTMNLLADAAAAFRSESSVAEAAAIMSKDRNPQLAAYGVRLSTLIQDVGHLSSYLLQPNEEGVREEAIRGLRKVIRQSDNGRKQVTNVLQNRLSNAELDNAMKMLEGISRTAAEDRTVSDWLVEMLGSNREALRAMAIENLEALTNERNGYSPDDDAGRRTVAIRRWERFVERNGGRLVQPVE